VTGGLRQSVLSSLKVIEPSPELLILSFELINSGNQRLNGVPDKSIHLRLHNDT
jgi:hypothetical protein